MSTLRLSIVTPTFNSAKYVRETLESIHGAVPPGVEVEHIVVDGGSEDATVAIAREYPCTIVEGEDDGLYDAMNIGIRRSRGDVIGIINSDDLLLPGALPALARWYRTRRHEWVVGTLRYIDANGTPHADLPPPPTWMAVGLLASLGWNPVHHPSTFLTRRLYDRVGEFDLSYRLAADYELLMRARAVEPYDRLMTPLAAFRRHGGSATIMAVDGARSEGNRIAGQHGPSNRLLRSVYRTFVRAWLNLRSPRWFVAKRRGRI